MTIETSFRPLQASEDRLIQAKPRVTNENSGAHELAKVSEDDQSEADFKQATPKLSELHDKVSEINAAVQEINRELKFRVDDESGRLVVNVVDRNSGETIRQIPSEHILELERQLAEGQLEGGLFKIVA